MPPIHSVLAREIFDSRGNPTVEVDVLTSDGLFRAAAPSGARSGVYEALELRDGDRRRMRGQGVLKAVENVNSLVGPKLVGLDVVDQATVDRLMVETLDGSKNEWGWSKARLGANAILAISVAVCRAGAACHDMEPYEYVAKLAGRSAGKFVLPVPAFSAIVGGSRAGNRLVCQEFTTLPVGASSFREAMVIGTEVYHALRSLILERYGQGACNVCDEGAFAPPLEDGAEALELLLEAVKQSGHSSKVELGATVAGSELYDPCTGQYDVDFKNPSGSSPEMKKWSGELVEVYKRWGENYPLATIEDPFDASDWGAYSHMMREMGKSLQLVGNELLGSNALRVQQALGQKACNAVLVSVSQAGTVTEAIRAASAAQVAGWGVVVSHRSGETEDSFIADFAVGLGAGQIKTGAPCRSERLAKYNQLLRIEEELGHFAAFAGRDFRLPHQAAGLPEPTPSAPELQRLVVVGYGPVAHSFVERLLSKRQGFQVTILCEEPFAAYNRVRLSTFFQHRSPDRLALGSASWCAERGVSLIFGKALAIDREARNVEYDAGGDKSLVAYDHLVLATGSRPFVPSALNKEVKGLFIYRTLVDAMAIVEHAKVAKVAAVVGGGLLGLEIAKTLLDLEVDVVHVLEIGRYILGTQIDAEGAALVREKLEGLGLKVHNRTRVMELFETEQGTVFALELDENDTQLTLHVDMVIVACGVRPRHELAAGCGLELGSRGGVKVDGCLRSVTDPRVHAVGDVASLGGGPCFSLSAPGYQQAEVLAEILANPDASVRYEGGDLSTKLKVAGVDVGSFGAAPDFWSKGLHACKDETKVVNLVHKAKGIYKKLVFSPNRRQLLGGILVGNNEDFAKLSAIARRHDLGGLSPEQVLTGHALHVDDGGDGTNLGPEDLLCNCHAVCKGVVKKAIADGADSFAEIRRCTQAGTGCGTCITTGPIPKLLAFTLRELRRPRGVSACMPFSEAEIEELAQARNLKTFDDLAAQLCPPSQDPNVLEAARSKVEPILERLFHGKRKGDGLDHVEQLRALQQDLWQFIDKTNSNPILLRLAWHDAGTWDPDSGTGGSNGSIAHCPERELPVHGGLSKAVKYLEPFKDDYPLVSWADLIQLAAAVAIEHAGGPKIKMRYGRQDVEADKVTTPQGMLPNAQAPYRCGAKTPAQHLRTIFNRLGFDDRSIVALCGAHTLGRAFKEREGLVAEGYGEANACVYTKSAGAPVRRDGRPGVGMPGGKSWTRKWLRFDNSYFSTEKDPNLVQFSTDACLQTDKGFKPWFMLYRADEGAFFRDYAEAHQKMSELGARFVPESGITLE